MRDWSHTSSIARRLLWWRRSLHRSPDDRVRGGDLFIDRRTIVFAEAIPSSIAGRSCSRRRSLLHTRLWVWGNCGGAAARKIANLKKALDGLDIRHILLPH